MLEGKTWEVPVIFLDFYLNTSKALAVRRLKEYTGRGINCPGLTLKLRDNPWLGYQEPEDPVELTYKLVCPDRPGIDGQEAIVHEVTPLADKRVKVQIFYGYTTPAFVGHLQGVLKQIMEDYPEASQKMVYQRNGYAEPELLAKRLVDFEKWLQRQGVQSDWDETEGNELLSPTQSEPAREGKKPRGRSKPIRQAKIRKLFEEENRQDLQVNRMARLYGVSRKTIHRDLKDLGFELPLGDKTPP